MKTKIYCYSFCGESTGLSLHKAKMKLGTKKIKAIINAPLDQKVVKQMIGRANTVRISKKYQRVFTAEFL